MTLLTPTEQSREDVRSQFSALAKATEINLERFEDWCNIWMSTLEAKLADVDRLERAGFITKEEADAKREEIRMVQAEYAEKKRQARAWAVKYIQSLFDSYPPDGTVH